MSLLLEALKKAELAKRGKQATDNDTSAAEIEFEPSPPNPADAPRTGTQNVVTRGQLPDISQPLEILSEDLPSSAQREPEQTEFEPAAAQPSRPAPPYRPAREPEPELEVESTSTAAAASMLDASEAAERNAARQLFETKEVGYHPKRNFYITIGVLAAAGAGYGGYVWWELQPKSVYNPAAVQNAAQGAPAAAVKQISAPPQVTPALAASPEPPAAPVPVPARGKPPVAARSAAATDAPAQAPEPQPRTVFAKSRATGAPAAAAARAPARAAARSSAPAPGPAQSGPSPIAITPPALAIDPLVERGFDAYQRNDFAGARASYQQALRRDPLNRDALLGMASIDVRERRFDSAQASYVRLLELDPRDVHASAGLIALRGQVNPAQSESRLKTLIATSPDAAMLYFALGNQYAQQSRWAEAQAAYFKAYAGDSENADFAVNLAISLDQLRKKAMALEYYHRAMALAANRPVSFDRNRIRTRIQELERR